MTIMMPLHGSNLSLTESKVERERKKREKDERLTNKWKGKVILMLLIIKMMVKVIYPDLRSVLIWCTSVLFLGRESATDFWLGRSFGSWWWWWFFAGASCHISIPSQFVFRLALRQISVAVNESFVFILSLPQIRQLTLFIQRSFFEITSKITGFKAERVH